MNHHRNLSNETKLDPKNNGVLKKSHKYLRGGKSSKKKSLKGPPNVADKISSGFSNILSSLSKLMIGEPPDVKFSSVPYVSVEGDKNLKTNMTSENREIFLDEIGSSPEGRAFKNYLERCQVVDDQDDEQKGGGENEDEPQDEPQGGQDEPQGGQDEPQGGQDEPQGGEDEPQGGQDEPQGGQDEPQGGEEEWTYTITPGQLKNYADKFCVSRDDLFGDEEKKNMFNLPDEKITFEASTKCEISDDEDDDDVDYDDDEEEESDDEWGNHPDGYEVQ